MGAASLEKTVLVNVVNRMSQDEGLRDELERELRELERRPAGKLLEKLKQLELPDDLAARILAAITHRNQLIHHSMERPDVMLAMMTGAEIDELVADIDSLEVECQQIINVIAA